MSEESLSLQLKGRKIFFGKSPLIAGILNLTEDSFCGDGSLESQTIISSALNQINAGADILDVGAESARTNRSPISVEEEVARFQKFFSLLPEILKSSSFRDEKQLFPPLISINTWREEVIEKLFSFAQFDILNDISGNPSEKTIERCAENSTSLCLMHNVRSVKTSAQDIVWKNGIWAELEDFFSRKISFILKYGLNPQSLILDPGIGFCKKPSDDLSIYHQLERLKKFRSPILLPVSRKHVVGHALNLWEEDYSLRDAGSLISALIGFQNGGNILRVHYVKGFVEAFRLLEVLQEKESLS